MLRFLENYCSLQIKAFYFSENYCNLLDKNAPIFRKLQ